MNSRKVPHGLIYQREGNVRCERVRGTGHRNTKKEMGKCQVFSLPPGLNKKSVKIERKTYKPRWFSIDIYPARTPGQRRIHHIIRRRRNEMKMTMMSTRATTPVVINAQTLVTREVACIR